MADLPAFCGSTTPQSYYDEPGRGTRARDGGGVLEAAGRAGAEAAAANDVEGVAILIFGAGAGVSIYEGIDKLLNPHPVTSPHINYIVLGLAVVFEAVAWWIAFRSCARSKASTAIFTRHANGLVVTMG